MRAVETSVDAAICEAFVVNLHSDVHAIVRAADLLALYFEAKLWTVNPDTWVGDVRHDAAMVMSGLGIERIVLLDLLELVHGDEDSWITEARAAGSALGARPS